MTICDNKNYRMAHRYLSQSSCEFQVELVMIFGSMGHAPVLVFSLVRNICLEIFLSLSLSMLILSHLLVTLVQPTSSLLTTRTCSSTIPTYLFSLLSNELLVKIALDEVINKLMFLRDPPGILK